MDHWIIGFLGPKRNETLLGAELLRAGEDEELEN
jgi:hypothetical protein